MLQPSGRPKRAAWDTKGQLEDLRLELTEFKETYKRDIAAKEDQHQQLVVEKSQEIVSVETKLTEQVRIAVKYHPCREPPYFYSSFPLTLCLPVFSLF